MKKTLIILTAILIIIPVLLLGGCKRPGSEITKAYSLSDFTRVQVDSAFEVIITPSDTYSISITAPENWFDRITVEKVGDTLEVGANIRFWLFWGSWRNHVILEVAMPELEAIDISGASSGTVKGFESAKDFRLNLSGASSLDMDIEAYDISLTVSGASKLKGDLKAHDVRMNISGASSVEIDGTINNLNLQVSGASSATLDNLEGHDGRIEISGASHAIVAVTGVIDVFLSGASSLEYTGNPQMGTVDISGASSMSRQ
ncbi:MAG: DUF2807 domain-containing protein [Dehalococcoidales bacterium]|nr:DUF2807 domain-containing protein [Dehalococcoidales bacterium]